MNIAFAITFFIVCVFTGLNTGKNNKLKKVGEIGTILSVLILYILGAISIQKWKNTIPAIEVYRGNTGLQIIYQDSIPIDSVVVYKNK